MPYSLTDEPGEYLRHIGSILAEVLAAYENMEREICSAEGSQQHEAADKGDLVCAE